ncbi:MAG: hypothetical protein NXI32_18290, partial [bacterium]|nr:hypothetical protein [bacterium]
MAERLEDRRLLAVVNWDGGGGDLNWNNPANWDTDQLPGVGDDVVIADIAPDIAIVHSSGTTSINSLVSDEALVISGGTLEIATTSAINDNLSLSGSSSTALTGAGDVTVDGLFTWTGGRLQGTGKLIASGGMQLEGSTKYLERTVDNAGTAIWASGTIFANADGVFNNLAGATFDARSDNTLSGSLATFNNAGVLLKSEGTSASSLSLIFNNSGSVQVQTGILALLGGDSSGSFQVDADSTLRFQGGTHVLDANATLSGAGTLSILNTGILDVASNISIGRLDMTSSSSSSNPILTGSGNVTVDGLFNWTGGRLQGTGKLIANGGMLIEGPYDKYLERTLDNAGTATWTDGRIRTSSATQFNNLVDATFDVQSDDSFGLSATGTFNNAGTLLKSAGTGFSGFYPALNNTGTVQVQSGTLLLIDGGTSNGSFQIDTAGILRLSNGTLVLNDGWDVTGAGNFLITGGTLDVSANGHVDNLTLSGSSSTFLTGAGDVTVDGLFTWTGGRLQGTGKLIASGGMQ